MTIDDRWNSFIENRSMGLRDELIAEYMPLVRFVVGRLGIPPTSLLEADDLVSYGAIGLINAIDRFDPARGIRFEAFATPRIRGAVIDHLRSINWLPRSAVSRIRQIEGVLAHLEQRLGRPAKEEEAAAELSMPIERYRQILLEVSTTVLSLDAPLGSIAQNEEMTSLGELLEDQHSLGPDEQAERHELALALSNAIAQLPSREQLLLALYYKEELTMKEISKIMSISESRVCQIHTQAIIRLRGALHAHRSEDVQEPVHQSSSSRRTPSQKSAAHRGPVLGNERSADEKRESHASSIAAGGGRRKRMIS